MNIIKFFLCIIKFTGNLGIWKGDLDLISRIQSYLLISLKVVNIHSVQRLFFSTPVVKVIEPFLADYFSVKRGISFVSRENAFLICSNKTLSSMMIVAFTKFILHIIL